MSYWLPIASAASIAQGGAALAVAFKTRDAKIKGLALPSALSAFMGITEPAIFGVNLRFFKPFIAGCIGGGLGALVDEVRSVRIVGDVSSVEVFMNDGALVFSTRIYPESYGVSVDAPGANVNFTRSTSRRLVVYRRYTSAVAHGAGSIRIGVFCL